MHEDLVLIQHSLGCSLYPLKLIYVVINGYASLRHLKFFFFFFFFFSFPRIKRSFDPLFCTMCSAKCSAIFIMGYFFFP